jgi:hypothetical protein
VPVRRRYKIGRPTKRTKAVLKVLFDAIKEGVPYKLACMAAGITYDCFLKWRQDDPDFDRQVEQLVAKPAIDLFKVIREQAPETWQAGAWALERRFPDMFAKPEAQLNIVATAQAAAIGPTNVVVVGPERAALLVSRHQAIRAKSMALLEGRGGSTGNGEREAEAPHPTDPATFQAVVDQANDRANASPASPESSPESRHPSAWWRRFVFGGDSDVFSRTDAVACVHAVLVELKISVAGTINFPGATVTNAELQKSLTELTGDVGWKALMSLYQSSVQREHVQGIWER